MPSEIQLVVFDLGRVLLRICDSWEHACDLAGISRPATLEMSEAQKAQAAEIIRRLDSGMMDVQTFAQAMGPLRGLQPTVTRTGEPTEIATRGRHDPCLLPRFVPMGEAMVALVLVDHWLRWRAQVGEER